MLLVFAMLPNSGYAAQSTSDAKKNSVCELYIGRLVRSVNRYIVSSSLLGDSIINVKGETDEDVLTELINKPAVWSKFSFEQKKEFTFSALVYGNLQGGALTTLLILLERDATPIANDLDHVSDKVLEDGYLLSQEGIRRYRNRIIFLKGSATTKMPK
jgi:hypothetical protein